MLLMEALTAEGAGDVGMDEGGVESIEGSFTPPEAMK